MNVNTLSILTMLIPFDRPHLDLQNDIKIVKIDKVLAFAMHQNFLCNIASESRTFLYGNEVDPKNERMKGVYEVATQEVPEKKSQHAAI